MTGTAGAAGFADDRQHDVLGSNAFGGITGDFNLHGFGATLFQGLGSQHMFHFRGTDTEGQ
ncbi:hypothetical protein D3C72_2498780 [compost metagenome]